MPLLNNDALDDPLAFDSCESFAGGQLSFVPPRLLDPTQAALVENLILYRSGELNTRKGTRTLGNNPASGSASRIQGLLYYNVTGSGDKLIAFTNGKAYWLNGASWDVLFDPKMTDATVQVDSAQLGDQIYFAGGYGSDPANGFTGGIRRWTGTAVESVDGELKEIDVTAGGSGYSGIPAVVISAPSSGGTQASATATVSGGVVVEIDITNPGSGYTSAPTVTISDGGGSGYTSPPTVVISAPGFGGTQATATATVSGGHVTGVSVTNAGSGYLSAPTVSFSGGGGSGAAATATLSGGGVSAINLVSGSGAAAVAKMKVCPQGCTMLTRHGTRLVAWGNPSLPDAVYFSMLLDGTQWEWDNGGLASATIRIGGGDGDPIVGCLSWTNFTLLVFKQNSTWAIQADPQTAPAQWTIQQIHRSIGCKSRRTIAQVGQDVFFLSNNGVQSVQKQLATDNNEIPVAMSYNVQDVLDGMNWSQASKACACFDSNFYTLWIPTASNTEPDTALVFHYLTGGWSIFTGVSACELLAMPYSGRTRLVIGISTGEVREWLNYLQDGEDADVAYLDGSATTDLSSRVLTRALTFDEPVCPKSGFYAEIEVVLTGCTLQVYAVRDGGDAELLLSTTLPSGALTFPLTFPIVLPKVTYARRRVNLQSLAPFRELQLDVRASGGPLTLRRILTGAFVDTLELKDEV